MLIIPYHIINTIILLDLISIYWSSPVSQIMWMGSGMGPMMFPGVQQYMSRLGMGVGHASMPSMHGPVQLPQVPFVNQSIASASTANQRPPCPSPALNAVNFPNQMQNVHPPEMYARYLGLHHMQPPSQVRLSHMLLYLCFFLFAEKVPAWSHAGNESLYNSCTEQQHHSNCWRSSFWE